MRTMANDPKGFRTHGAERHVYSQSYRRMEIFEDRFTDQFFIKGRPGEQFGSISLCEDEIDRVMDRPKQAFAP